MSSAAAIDRHDFHGLKPNPNVKRSESERMPGKRNRSHVPPIASRPSRIAKLRLGARAVRGRAAPMPEMPPPTMRTSKSVPMPHASLRADPPKSRLLQIHLDGHAALLVAARHGVPGVVLSADAHPDRGALAAEVAPPPLALGPSDADLHRAAVAPVAHRDGLRAPAAPARDGEEREPAAERRVQRRVQEQPDARVAD